MENPTAEVDSIIAGFDLMSEEEQKKMADRNARFAAGNAVEMEEEVDPNAIVDLEKRQARLERFGIVDPSAQVEGESGAEKKEKVRAPRRAEVR